MTLPNVQSLLLPTLRLTADGAKHSVEEIQAGLRELLKITPEEAGKTHTKSGLNIFVNRVAWALAHLVMGQAIVLKGERVYQITERGSFLLKGNPSDLTIADLH